MDSILNTIKKMLGIEADYKVYDTDIIVMINSELETLRQMGVGPEEGFFIEDDEAVWTDFVESPRLIQQIKLYIFLKVKMIFDPPTTSFVIDSYNKQIEELTWRLYIPTGSLEEGGEK